MMTSRPGRRSSRTTSKYHMIKPYDLKEVVDKDIHLRGLQTFSENCGKYEQQPLHAAR